MGVLDISQRKVSLGNLGEVRAVNTNTGELEAAERIAASVRRLSQSNIQLAGASGDMGKAIGDGLGALGRGAASLSVDLMKMRRIDDESAADGYVAKFQEGMEKYNNGGEDSVGTLNETVDDERAWLERNIAYRDKLGSKLKDELKMTEDQMRIAQKRLVGYNLGLQNSWGKKASQVRSAREVNNAKGRWEMARSAVLSKDADPLAWVEWRDSLDNLLDKSGRFGAEDRANEFRKQGEFVEGVLIKRYLTETSEAAVAAGADGDKVWNGAIAILEGADDKALLPDNSWIEVVGKSGNVVEDKAGNPMRENILKRALRDADMKSLKEAAIKDAKAAKAGWEAGMRKHTKESFVNAQNDILAIPAPEDGDELGQKNYQREVADAYRRLIAKDPRVLSGRGDEWVRDDLKKFAPDKVAIALRAIKGAEDKADVARVRANGQIFLRSFTVGVPDPMVAGGRRQLTTAEKNNLTEFLYTNGEISHEDYARAMKMVSAETTPVAQKFLSMISEGMNGKFPKVCEWQDRLMAYRFKDTNEAKELAKEETGIESSYQSDTNEEMNERLLFNEYADFASLVMQKMVATGPKQGESEGDMLLRAKDEFDKLTRGTNEGIYRLSVKRRQEAYRRNVDAIVNTNRNRINVAEGLPRGMELSRQTQAAQGGASGGRGKRKEEK